MKRTSFFILLLIVGAGLIQAQSPKREMRAAWLTTCWAIDWPKTSGAANQQAEMINILDAYASANMNAVFFQVRGRSDAMYNSAYEPWSSDLKGPRGTNPGYDPLQFVINEARKRGMEVHAWLNPYRYESTLNAWAGLPGDFKNDPAWADHILTYAPSGNGQMSIFDPGRPKVLQHIKNIVGDILSKYDVDGIVFDDYFYVSGTGNLDAATQALYNTSGMNVADWRRKNVNTMIAAVYDTIQKVKPYVTFGVSPAGVAKGGAADAGVSPPPITGSDWQYSGIYADPLAWLKEGSIDYISPQIYWSHTSSGNPFGTLSKWWAEVAKKFGKHVYVSQSFASGNQVEQGKQIESNRTYDLSGAPGTVFFSTIDFLPSIVRSYLKENQFKLKALPPAIDWKSHPTYNNVGEVTLTARTLNWTPVSGVPGGARYSVYAVPASLSDPKSHCNTSRYLLGMTYTTDFTVPVANAYGYNFVVGLLDRYGNEYLTGQTTPLDPTELSVPKIFAPENGSTIESPFTVEWYPVPAATGYTVERSASSAFTGATSTTVGADVFQTTFTGLANNTTYYVRVRANDGANPPTGWSETVRFTAMTVPAVPVITAPMNTALVPTFVTVSWGADARATRGFTLQRSTNEDFSGSPVSNNINAGTDFYTFPASGTSALPVGSTQYVRVRARYDTSSDTEWSVPVQFRVYNPAVERLLILGEDIGGAPYLPHLPMPYTIDVGQVVALGIRTGTNAGTSADWLSRLDHTLTSSKPNVATVSDYGVVTGVAPGTTIIKAVEKLGSKREGTIELTVRGIPLTLELDKITIDVAETAQLTITDGEEFLVNALECTLTTGNDAVATVSETGIITGVGAGTAKIIAIRNSDNAMGVVSITVEKGNNILTPDTDKIIVYNSAEGIVALFNGEANVELYTVTGFLIDKTKAFQTYSRKLEKGIYILRVNGKVIKVSPLKAP